MKFEKKILKSFIIVALLANYTFVFANEPQDQLPKKVNPKMQSTSKHFEKQDLYFQDLTEKEYNELKKAYKKVTDEDKLIYSIELLSKTCGKFSQKAILGSNLSDKPIKVQFRNLSELSAQHASFDALGWKKSGKLYIFINDKHKDAPPIALASLLAHEAIHQDEYNSLNEETYAWTLEANVWYELSKQFPKEAASFHPLVVRENTLKELLIKGNFSDKYIRKSVYSNPGYSNLSERSPGFEEANENL